MTDTSNIVMTIPKRQSIITIVFIIVWVGLTLHNVIGKGASKPFAWLFILVSIYLMGVLFYTLFGKVEIALEVGKLLVSKKIFSSLLTFSSYELSKIKNVREVKNEKGDTFLAFGRSPSFTPEFLRWYYDKNPVVVYFVYDGDKEIKIGEGLEAFDSKKLMQILKHKK